MDHNKGTCHGLGSGYRKKIKTDSLNINDRYLTDQNDASLTFYHNTYFLANQTKTVKPDFNFSHRQNNP